MSRTDTNTTNRQKGIYRVAQWRAAYTHAYYGTKYPALPRVYTENKNFGRFTRNTEVRSSGAFKPWPYISSDRVGVNAFSYTKEFVREMRQSRISHTNGSTFGGEPPTYTNDEGYFVTDTTDEGSIAWYTPTYLAVPQSEIDNIDAELRTKIRNEIKDMKFNAQQFIAEREQTIQLFIDVVTSVTKVIHGLRTGDIVGAANAVGIRVGKRKRRKYNRSYAKDQSKAAANAWIGMQYGVRPLLEDVKGAAESLAKLMSAPSPIQRAEVHKAIKMSADRSWADYYDMPRNLREIQTTEYHMKYVCYYTYDLNVSSIPTSLGLTNPASILWELTPWSFVVDWFFPIGNWIASFDATVGLVFHSGCKTTFAKYRSRRETFTPPGSQWGQAFVDSCTGEAYREKIDCHREKLTTFPSIARPVMKNPLSVQHLLNALSLLRQNSHKVPQLTGHVDYTE
jgi:hypothetical protein